MIWLKITRIYLTLGAVVIALSTYKKYHPSDGAECRHALTYPQ